MSNSIFVIGNGLSRKDIDLSKLDGLTIGCNALYRDFTPDLLCALDAGVISEIINSGYDGPCAFTMNSWNLLPAQAYEEVTAENKWTQKNFGRNRGGSFPIVETPRGPNDDHFVFISGTAEDAYTKLNHVIWVPKKLESKIINLYASGVHWNTGTAAVELATKDVIHPCIPNAGRIEGQKSIYLLGFDLFSKNYDNVYADSKNYHKEEQMLNVRDHISWEETNIRRCEVLFRIIQRFTEIEFYWIKASAKSFEHQVTKWFAADEKIIRNEHGNLVAKHGKEFRGILKRDHIKNLHFIEEI